MEKDPRSIFKILTGKQWEDAQRETEFDGAAIDLADGFIHLSTAAQLPETLAKHFADQPNLVLLTVDVASVEEHLKWEPSRGGELFPHLYSTLNLGDVKRVDRLSAGADGRVSLPTNMLDNR